MFYRDERLALFMDGAAMQTAAESLGIRIDYRRIHTEFKARGRLLAAYYFAAVGDRSDYEGLTKLHDWLSYNHYRFVSKPLKVRHDDNGGRTFKSNMLVELSVTALELAPVLDHAVIFSGDEELVPLVEGLQRAGVRVSIVSSRNTSPPLVADELRRQADNFIELDDLCAVTTPDVK